MKEKRHTHVLLTVDTGRINDKNIESCVMFTDDRKESGEKPGKPQDFISSVDRNMKIYWTGKAQDDTSGDVVEITRVSRKALGGGSEILERTFRDRNQNGRVIGQIKDRDVKGEELYDVEFRINNDDLKEFTVDPKLRMTSTD